MKIEMFCIKDNLIGFSQPFCVANEAVAIRQFAGSAIAKEPNVVNTYPENKELWKVGVIDDQTGFIESDVKYLARAVDFIKKELVDDVGSAEESC